MGKKYQLVTGYTNYGQSVVQPVSALCHSSKQSKRNLTQPKYFTNGRRGKLYKNLEKCRCKLSQPKKAWED